MRKASLTKGIKLRQCGVCSDLSLFPLFSSTSLSSPLIIASGRELSGRAIVDTTLPVVCMARNALSVSDFSVQQDSLSGVFCDAIPGQKAVSIRYQTSNSQNATTNTRKNKRVDYTSSILSYARSTAGSRHRCSRIYTDHIHAQCLMVSVSDFGFF